MTETLTFPGLGLSFDISRVAFWIGDFPIYWYGITFALGFLLGLLYFQATVRKVGIHPDEGLDTLLWAVIGGVVGARLYFVVFQWEALYKANPLKIFAFREGGLAIYGGVIGAVAVGYIVSRIKKQPLLPMLDVGLPALLLAQAVGRWGNFFNIEAFGGNTELPWGMTSHSVEQYLSRSDVVESLAKLGQTANPFIPVHPTFFYEFLWNLVGFLVLALLVVPRRRYDGQAALGYAAWYGLGRFFIEGLRTDSLVANTPWGLVRVSQWLALAGVVVSLLLMLWIAQKLRSEQKPAWLGIYANTERSAELLAKADASAKNGKKNKANAEDESGQQSGDSAQAAAADDMAAEGETTDAQTGAQEEQAGESEQPVLGSDMADEPQEQSENEAERLKKLAETSAAGMLSAGEPSDSDSEVSENDASADGNDN